MQAFFLLNGYTSNFRKPFKSFLCGSFKSLIIPYVTFSVLCKAIDALLWGETSLWQKTCVLGEQEWFFMEESYWFLSALFLARILYWLLCKYIKNENLRGVTAFAIMLTGFCLNHLYDGVCVEAAHFNNHLHYRNALCMMIFIWAGEWMKNHEETVKKFLKTVSFAYIILVIGTHLIGKGCAPSYVHSTGIQYHQIPQYVFYATSGSVCIIWVARKINKNRVLEYLGRGSLVVYASHFAYVRIVTKSLSAVLYPSGLVSGMAFYILTFVLVALLSAATVWVFNLRYMKVLVGKF